MCIRDRDSIGSGLVKSRPAHLKPMTVSRLELSAAVLAVKSDKSVREELDVPITQSTYWSDSTCVL